MTKNDVRIKIFNKLTKGLQAAGAEHDSEFGTLLLLFFGVSYFNCAPTFYQNENVQILAETLPYDFWT